MRRLYGWLAELTDMEARLARASAADRGEVIRAIQNLPNANLGDAHLW